MNINSRREILATNIEIIFPLSSISLVMISCVGSEDRLRPYSGGKLEKVRFGVSLDQVCKQDQLPGPLLMMLLQLNKEGPFKKEVFRAPGNAQSIAKLIHFLQQGRLVNIQSYSLSTIASVVKEFLRKIPGGIFGKENETALFYSIDILSAYERMISVNRLITSLPIYSQHILVLLFGTFRIIAANSLAQGTNMTAEALGVSVAPSFFHTCVSAGKIVSMDDVERFKDATAAISYIIDNFGMRNLFGRENYEYYARLTGRILKIEDECIFFTYPLDCLGIRSDLDIKNRSDYETDPTGSLEMIADLAPPPEPSDRLSLSLSLEVSSSPPRSRSNSRLSQSLRIQSPVPDIVSWWPESPSQDLVDLHSSYLDPNISSFTEGKVGVKTDWFNKSGPGGLVTYKLKERSISPGSNSQALLGNDLLTELDPCVQLQTIPDKDISSLSELATSSQSIGTTSTSVLKDISRDVTGPSIQISPVLSYTDTDNFRSSTNSTSSLESYVESPSAEEDNILTNKARTSNTSRIFSPSLAGLGTTVAQRRKLFEPDKEKNKIRLFVQGNGGKRKDKENGRDAQ